MLNFSYERTKNVTFYHVIHCILMSYFSACYCGSSGVIFVQHLKLKILLTVLRKIHLTDRHVLWNIIKCVWNFILKYVMPDICQESEKTAWQTSHTSVYCYAGVLTHWSPMTVCSVVGVGQYWITWWPNSSPPSATYMRQWIGLALVQIMACRLFCTKPLSKPVLGYCQLDPLGHISVKFQSKYKYFHSRKCIWKYLLRNGGHFVQGEMN